MGLAIDQSDTDFQALSTRISICQPQAVFFPVIKTSVTNHSFAFQFTKLNNQFSIMEILMDFNKPSISKKIEKFLLDNLKTEKEKESLISVITGKSLLKCDAIALLITVVQAMTIAAEIGDEEFSVVTPKDDDEREDFPTLAQSMEIWSQVESKGKKPNLIEPASSGSNLNAKAPRGD